MSSRGRSTSPRPLSNDEDINMGEQRTKSDSKIVTIKNLSRNVVESHLRCVFGYYGEIAKISLPVYGKSGQNKGKAAVTFLDNSAASQAASHMDGGHLDGAIINVVVSDSLMHSRSRSRSIHSASPIQTARSRLNGRSRQHALSPSYSRSRSRSHTPVRRPAYAGRSPPPRYNQRGRYRGGRTGARQHGERHRPKSSSRSLSRSHSPSPPRRGGRRRSPSYERGGTGYRDRRYKSPPRNRGRSRSYSTQSTRSRTRSWSSRSRGRSRSFSSFSSRSRSESPRARSRTREDIRDSRSRSATPDKS